MRLSRTAAPFFVSCIATLATGSASAGSFTEAVLCTYLVCPEPPPPPQELDPAAGYTTIEVPSDGIEKYLPIGAEADHLPVSIRGVWWMDGNPLGDILLTLGHSVHDPATRIAVLPVYGPGNYTYYPAEKVRNQYLGMVRKHFSMIIAFNEDFTYATVTPHDDDTPVDLDHSGLPPETTFTMTLVEDGHWVRSSSYYGIPLPDYQLRRVVRADGVWGPAYVDYLKAAQPTSEIGIKK